MSKKVSVETWRKKALQASAMRCGACTEATGLVGVDMIAQDGNVFSHGHFDIQTAIANVAPTGWLPPQLRVKSYDGPPKAKAAAPAPIAKSPRQKSRLRRRRPQRKRLRKNARRPDRDSITMDAGSMGGDLHEGVVAFRPLTLGREAVMLGRVTVGEIMPVDRGHYQACFRLLLPEASATSWRPCHDVISARRMVLAKINDWLNAAELRPNGGGEDDHRA